MNSGNFDISDMRVVGRPPAKLIKALAVIADSLHAEYARLPWIAHANKSKESCVLCSLTVRDFLFKIGFTDVVVAPVYCVIRAMKEDGQLLHSLAIGETNLSAPKRHGRWNGHMVVLLPTDGYLIDTTLYPARRPQWPELPTMIAAPINRAVAGQIFGLSPLAGLSFGALDGAGGDIVWLDQPKNKLWRDGSDAKKPRRQTVVNALVQKFGPWQDASLSA